MTEHGQGRRRLLSPRYLVDKVREKGLLGSLSAAKARVFRGMKRFASRLAVRVRWVFPSLRFMVRPSRALRERILAVYDFRTHPYAVGELLWFQEMTLVLRLEHQVDKIDIVWLCDQENPASKGRGMTRENYYYHLSTLLPLAHINPHLGTFLLMDSPKVLEEYLANNGHRYRHTEPNFREYAGGHRSYQDWHKKIEDFYTNTGSVPSLSCKPSMLLWAKSFIAKEIRPAVPVAVLIRRSLQSTRRNAHIESWLEFFEHCKNRYDVKFIVIGTRDEIDPRFRSLGNVVCAKDFGTTVEQDLALVQVSLMYLGNTSGPGVMSVFSDRPYRIFNYRPSHTKLPFGSQFSHATAHQKLVWEPETTELLIKEFTSILEQVDTVRWGEDFDLLASNSGSMLAGQPNNSRSPDSVLR